MPEDPALGFPYLHRKMLDFEAGAAFELRITTIGAVASTVTLRGFTKSGPFSVKHSDPGSGSATSSTFRIPDIPIMLDVVDDNNSHDLGNLYVTVSLLVSGEKICDLTSGYVYQNKSISFPLASLPDIRPGQGEVTPFSVSAPAAGAEWSYAVPSGRHIRIYSIRFTFATDATAANRRPHIVHSRGATTYQEMWSTTVHTASVTRNYSCSPTGWISGDLDDNDQFIPLPSPFIIRGGDTLATSTVNIQAGDAYTAITIYGELWMNPST